MVEGCVSAKLTHATSSAFIWTAEDGNGSICNGTLPPFLLLSAVCLASTTTNPFSLSITHIIGFGYLMHRVRETSCMFGDMLTRLQGILYYSLNCFEFQRAYMVFLEPCSCVQFISICSCFPSRMRHLTLFRLLSSSRRRRLLIRSPEIDDAIRPKIPSDRRARWRERVFPKLRRNVVSLEPQSTDQTKKQSLGCMSPSRVRQYA